MRTLKLLAVAAALAFSAPAVSAELSLAQMVKLSPVVGCMISIEKGTGKKWCSNVTKIPGLGHVFSRCPIVAPGTFDGKLCEAGLVPEGVIVSQVRD